MRTLKKPLTRRIRLKDSKQFERDLVVQLYPDGMIKLRGFRRRLGLVQTHVVPLFIRLTMGNEELLWL
jgi:hypothetical protein